MVMIKTDKARQALRNRASLSVQDQQLVFSVKNAVEQGAPEPVKENIGLSNLRRQLELQYRSYSLVTTCDATEFRALLTINLASHA